MADDKKIAKLTLKLDSAKKLELENLFKKPAKKEEITQKESPKTTVAPKIATKQDQQVKPTILKEDKMISKGNVKDESKKEANEAPKNTPKKKKHNIIAPKDYMEIIKYLQKNYSKCFSKEEIKPLEIGIKERLLSIEEIPFSDSKLRNFLKAYTRTKKYKERLIVGASRVNLAGEETSKVLDQEAPKNM